MKRSTLRVDPAKVRAWQERSRRAAADRARQQPRKALPRESAKRKAERPRRAAVRAEALRRAGWRPGIPVARVCAAREIVPEVACWHPAGVEPDVDEVVSRGVRPGSHLDVEATQVLCRAHHDWRHAEPDEAERRGLRRRSTS